MAGTSTARPSRPRPVAPATLDAREGMSRQNPQPIGAALRATLAICLLALPFELAAGLAIGPLTLTNAELLLIAAAGLWLARLLAERRLPDLPGWLVAGSAALVGALLLSAALAPEPAGALKFALRQAQGALLALCLADTLRRGGGARLFSGALLAGAAVSAALGLLELSESPHILAALAPFKTESTAMGGLLRLSATFSYANTAAQYYEALLPLAVLVGAGCGTLRAGRPGAQRLAWRALSGALPALLLLATLLTYSRAALAVTALLLLITPAAAWLAWGGRAGRAAGALCGGLAALALLLAAVSPTFRLRVAAPEVADWFDAEYRPGRLPTLAPGELRRVPITLRNSGRIPWDNGGLRPVRLAYHWLDAETGAMVQFEGRRTPLPRPVAPGESLTLSADVQAPAEPGRYLLAWDLVREYIGRGWFSQMGVPPARIAVAVGVPPADAAAAAALPPIVAPAILPQPGPPGRRELWGTAIALWLERPLLGIGPDRFRHVYGPRLGREPFDDRIHTNNLYLELLTGAGLLGLAAFLALMAACLRAGFGGLLAARHRSAGGQAHHEHPPGAGATHEGLLIGALLGLVAYLAHGMLDVFLAFTPTYALFWALLGVVAGVAPARRTADAAERQDTIAPLPTSP